MLTIFIEEKNLSWNNLKFQKIKSFNTKDETYLIILSANCSSKNTRRK
jgi:hypothetical protein